MCTCRIIARRSDSCPDDGKSSSSSDSSNISAGRLRDSKGHSHLSLLMPGGSLDVNWGDKGGRATMTGPSPTELRLPQEKCYWFEKKWRILKDLLVFFFLRNLICIDGVIVMLR